MMKWISSLFGKTKPAAPADPRKYIPYTRAFDREVHASQLDSVLGALPQSQVQELEEAWSAFQGGMLVWRTRLHLEALEASADIRAAQSEAWLKDCAISILVDQSGSMRGQSMLMAAAAIDVAQDFLRHLGCGVEILGFTTSSWQGGKSRKLWLSKGGVAFPGRLCDLLHIVYQTANEVGTGTGGWHFRQMLRPDLPKENVDGEALQWAATRLQVMPQVNKYLIVVSDGAPVDDSTLMENGLNYMHDHLKLVASSLQSDRLVRVAAIGIGHDVRQYYSDGTMVNTPADLGSALIGKLKSVLMTPDFLPPIGP